ncbi:sigma-54-dependent transcriptional regulator [Rubellicoccus peritrichatus]|uniref:Response regulator n=1 Tax=Rubellicoccus peritrichatus TaxID=3080537 RepID=A0AAQ3LB66_9BACT|nr:response regulator [Puniceicoccus sp. CR14]WOO42869.1 response regulator [Puniceicoccus sp. CR14]
MGKRILILDDDADFNHLLTDIFSQADYDVTSERDPEVAVGLFDNSTFDLVVTDQKMPGLSGEEFIREVKAKRPDLPVIMVSGYLDNDTIRRLIKEGVGGVFLKPLNVFSLLKRTAALIEEREAGLRRKEQADLEQSVVEPEHFQHSLPFSFKTFPCKAAKSVEFAKKLYSLRNFKSNLIIVAAPGVDMHSIIDDLNGFDVAGEEAFLFVDSRHLSEDGFLELIDQGVRRGASRVTLVIGHAERMTSPQKKIVFAASSGDAPFESIGTPLRFIFHVSDDLDDLYDAGEIDDDLYMFMGTSEVKVPALVDIREDIPLLAHSFMRDECDRLGLEPIPSLESPARVFLRDWDWPGNAAELKRMLSLALELEKPRLSREDLREIGSKIRSSSNAKRFDLRHELENHRTDLCRAALIFSNEEPTQASSILNIPPDLISSVSDLDGIKKAYMSKL